MSNYTESSDSDSYSNITNSLSSESEDSDYIPSQTPESEDYTSYESSELQTPSESSSETGRSLSLTSSESDSETSSQSSSY